MPKPVVYYDGGCPVCRREIGFYQTCPGAERIAWQDISRAPELVAADLTRGQALARLHARRGDGTLVNGAAAFALIWEQLPAFKPAAWLLRRAPILALAEWLYNGFLRLRRLWRRA
ncbi:thiol-disulfide oxidoreductase DCC family protein [Acidocella facilis]|uniref:thiol-disulfide oxidoreductase DCC family protein n=1 Tax=Acidocella facilis TaxID=525 RepID=UPI001F3E4CDE|nr:DUF393 domain-containing protein [Acidocella facilis]